jgi:hypothetical protein
MRAGMSTIRRERRGCGVTKPLLAESPIIPIFQEQCRTQRLTAFCSDISGIKTSAATLSRRRPELT